jgi:hypothetical protein
LQERRYSIRGAPRNASLAADAKYGPSRAGFAFALASADTIMEKATVRASIAAAEKEDGEGDAR